MVSVNDNLSNVEQDQKVSAVQLNQVSADRKKYVNHQYVNFQYVDCEDDNLSSRDQWNNKIEFLLSVIGYAVGLGNIWRFPYLAYKNGGGSFLIPYIVMLFGTGLPLFFMELALGQYAGQGPTKLFGKLAPIFKGLGFSMLLVAFLVSIYYNMIIAWALYYLGNSFSSTLPWLNGTNSTDYFYNAVLGIDYKATDKDGFGDFRWQLVVCLFSAWVLVCICLIKGVSSIGKAVYVTGKLNLRHINRRIFRCFKVVG